MSTPPRSKSVSRPKLGRGLAALLGDAAGASSSDKGTVAEHKGSAVSVLPVEALVAGPFQPRQDMEPGALEELAASIRERGILQPILVRPDPNKKGQYQIIAGERRWRAAQLAQCHDVPVHVRNLSEADAMAAALVENLQRADLNPVEEAEGFNRLMDEYSLTQEDLAKAIGKSRPHVANTLRLLKLPEAVRAELKKGALSAGHARALLAHPNATAAAAEVIARGLSVRQTEALVQKALEQQNRKPVVEEKKDRNPEIAALERDLASRLGLKVAVNFDGRKGGSLEIHYKSLDQLDTVLALLKS
ncbi:ParB/RepB/Spo0J family partition protein [Acetobacter syzygii]|uniref:ParB/RepB/Spo0J family partition protein n=1 Tax=Acetobacter syzygii TaxID=146476 RepID=UPI00156F9182|nr:ParB/RepB/Spo0J family partition protein [Acetobacter syzygii]NSL92540.1 ParB/RepB/Spo0J family partition protein [Acetobacter syzygii]